MFYNSIYSIKADIFYFGRVKVGRVFPGNPIQEPDKIQLQRSVRKIIRVMPTGKEISQALALHGNGL